MENKIDHVYIYVANDGTKKDVRGMNTAYLLNAMNNNVKKLFETTDSSLGAKLMDNISNVNFELIKRINNHYEKVIGGRNNGRRN